jgi:hypothetical protein
MHSKYPEESPYSFVKNMPIIAVDPDGERVYVVIERAEMKDGKEIMVKKVYDVLLDRELLELAAPDFVAYYDLALETELGKQDVQPFEDSETEDIYFAMVDFVSTEDDGLTLGRASNNVNVVDGKISPIKTLDDEEKLYYEYEEVFEGVLVNPEKQIHIISMNTQWFDEIIFEILGPEDGAGVILHEVIFHISWSNDGVSTLDQHDKAYGTTRDIHKDLCSKATEESPQRLLEEQVKDAIKIREGKKNLPKMIQTMEINKIISILFSMLCCAFYAQDSCCFELRGGNTIVIENESLKLDSDCFYVNDVEYKYFLKNDSITFGGVTYYNLHQLKSNKDRYAIRFFTKEDSTSKCKLNRFAINLEENKMMIEYITEGETKVCRYYK